MKTFVKYLESKGLANNTVESIYGDVIPFINWCEDENVEAEQTTYTEILSYIKYIQKRGIKQRTVQVYTGSLKHYFSWLIKREIREDNPIRSINIRGVKRQYLYDILKKQELETLYENFEIPSQETNKHKNQNWFKTSKLTSRRNKVILGLMIWQGLGTRELGKLEVKDLKLREGKIYVSGSRRSNERELKLEAHQVLDLMEYTLQVRAEILKFKKDSQSDLLFVSVGDGSRFGSMMEKLLKKLKKQNSRIKNVKQIRVSVITHWLQHYNLREVQYKAGHRYVSSTEAYLVNDLEGLQEDIAKFHPIG